ncbi:class I SAM-dependent methyltransferase [Candidatus Nanohalovita haloferacivicina]|uniref:class I SAM-dependent methyltransferase n=1 Tax=Candidatus Nanohalovita haloferacivicina TaxID=2978046 RepID=UPI00325FA5C2|nr:tRNA (guanine37-N1)-methyltransferase [Candidatus Nanohalobia archaeon BNXNv]
MKQEELEARVRELFERQGFKVEKDGNQLTASNGKKIVLKVFSSEKYSAEDVSAEKEVKVFVDEGLEEVKEDLDNDVSIIYNEEEEEDFETPSYEVIGDIAVINDLAGVNRDEAVEGILHHQNVKTILLKDEGLSGEFRLGDYEKLYGEETETVHKEFGYRFKVDPTEVYFSERFGTERKRVADQVEDGERVLVMFAGVGPFAMLCSEKADEVVAVEKNPAGAEFLKENIELNKVENVEGLEGDVEEVVPGMGEFDRIIMPLPESANEFLGLALDHISNNGVIHYYRFVEDGNTEEIEAEIMKEIEQRGFEYKILDTVECGERGPTSTRMCFDLQVTKSI